MRRFGLLALLACASGVPAMAQERPATTPTRDVDVLYRATAGGHTVEQRSRFGTTAQKTRIDTPSPGLYLLVDRGAHRMDVVSDADKGVLEMPYDPARVVGSFSGGQTFTRAGAESVAGLACTDWQTTDTSGRTITACFTEDGVLLRARAGATVFVEATRVAYGPIDPAVFTVPSGYQRKVARGSAQ